MKCHASLKTDVQKKKKGWGQKGKKQEGSQEKIVRI